MEFHGPTVCAHALSRTSSGYSVRFDGSLVISDAPPHIDFRRTFMRLRGCLVVFRGVPVLGFLGAPPKPMYVLAAHEIRCVSHSFPCALVECNGSSMGLPWVLHGSFWGPHRDALTSSPCCVPSQVPLMMDVIPSVSPMPSLGSS